MTTDGQDLPSSEVRKAIADAASVSAPTVSDHDTLKYHLLGPSLTKAGQDTVDQQKVGAG